MSGDAPVLRWIERAASAVLAMSAADLPPAARHEIAGSVRHACAAEARRRGVPGLATTAVAELGDLASMSVRRRFGIDPQITEAGPGSGLSPFKGPHMLIDDFRRAAKRLRSNVGGLALTAGMLAVAIGVSAAMFTVLDALVLNPVPFRDAKQLTAVVMSNGRGGYMPAVPRALFDAWRTSGVFAAVEGAMQAPVTLETGQGLVSKGGARISPGMLDMLGVKPILGRGFAAGEGRNGTDDRILLSEDVWTTLFGRDPGLIGRRIRVGGNPVEVIGILPADFRFPYSNVVTWRPIDFSAPPATLERVRVMAFARRAGGVPEADALRAATDAGRAVGALPEGSQLMFRPIAAGMVDKYSRGAITTLSAGVGLVFLVLCANAMNLMLTRFSARQREFGMCSALGASRLRLLREALAETLLLGLAASAAGLLLGYALVQIATNYLPDAFLTRTLSPVVLSWRAIAVTSLLGFVAAAIAGVVPAWMATRVDAAESLRLLGTGGTEIHSRRRLARLLLVGEVALATTLLAGAALLVRTFVNLNNIDRGLNAEGVITGWVALPEFAFKERAGRLAFAAALEERLKQLPGVQASSVSGGVPPTHGSIYFGTLQPDTAGATPINAGEIMAYSVGAEFFELFGIRIVAGRTFSPVSTPDDVIIGETLARRLWPGGAAAGRSFQIEGHKTWYRVVGVATEVRNPLMDPRTDSVELYHPLVVERNGTVEASAFGSGQIFFGLRCGDSCPSLPAISEAIRSVNPQVVIATLGPLEEDYAEGLARPRAAAVLAIVFAGVALLAAAGGLFGVLSAAVARRKREFGIRVALGIEPARLARLVFVDALKLAAMGIGAGLLGAWMLGRSLASLTYEVSAADPQSLAAICAALGLAILVASWRPAVHAARVDPVALLRQE